MENRCFLSEKKDVFVKGIKRAGRRFLLWKIKSECLEQIISVYGRRNFFAA